MESRRSSDHSRTNRPGRSYYAVENGRNTGVYSNWSQCEQQVKNYSNDRYKKFDSMYEAQRFVDGHNQTRGISGRSMDNYWKNSSESTSCTSNSKHAIVYTDGACSNNGYSGAKAGYGVYWGENDPRNVSEPLTGRATNNRAEIQAVKTAIKQAKEGGYESVTVRTDSQYSIDSMNSWVGKWSQNGWKTSNGNDVANKEDFKELQSAMDGIKVKWEKVPAHSGIPGNEAANKLAVRGAANMQ